MDFKAGGEKKDTMLMNHLGEICEGLHRIFPDKSAAEFKRHLLRGRKKGSRNYLIYPKRISYIQYKEVKRLPVFKLNKYKGGFHEQPFNQRKKPFGLPVTISFPSSSGLSKGIQRIVALVSAFIFSSVSAVPSQ